MNHAHVCGPWATRMRTKRPRGQVSVCQLLCASSDSSVAPKTPTFQLSYSPCQVRQYLGTVLPCPRDARRPLRTLLSTAQSHASNHPPFPDLTLFLSPSQSFLL